MADSLAIADSSSLCFSHVVGLHLFHNTISSATGDSKVGTRGKAFRKKKPRDLVSPVSGVKAREARMPLASGLGF